MEPAEFINVIDQNGQIPGMVKQDGGRLHSVLDPLSELRAQL